MDIHLINDLVILGQVKTHLGIFQTMVSTKVSCPDTLSWVKGDLPLSFSIPQIRFLHGNIALRIINWLTSIPTSIGINIPP